jgi:ketosteroid isomerase-like protein
MATQTIEAELLELEERFWQAMKDLDVDTAVRLTAEPCVLTGAQGAALVDRKTFREMMKAPNYTLDRYEIKDGVQVRQLQDDVAVIAYEVHEELTVEGKPVALDAVECSTWVRIDGQWLCAAHSEALRGDPFGRDRQPAK